MNSATTEAFLAKSDSSAAEANAAKQACRTTSIVALLMSGSALAGFPSIAHAQNASELVPNEQTATRGEQEAEITTLDLDGFGQSFAPLAAQSELGWGGSSSDYGYLGNWIPSSEGIPDAGTIAHFSRYGNSTVDLGGDQYSVHSWTVAGNRDFTFQNGKINFAGDGGLFNSSSGTVTVDVNLGTSGTISQDGPGTLVLSGYSADFKGEIRLNGGTVSLGDSSGNVPHQATYTFDGGRLLLNNNLGSFRSNTQGPKFNFDQGKEGTIAVATGRKAVLQRQQITVGQNATIRLGSKDDGEGILVIGAGEGTRLIGGNRRVVIEAGTVELMNDSRSAQKGLLSTASKVVVTEGATLNLNNADDYDRVELRGLEGTGTVKNAY